MDPDNRTTGMLTLNTAESSSNGKVAVYALHKSNN